MALTVRQILALAPLRQADPLVLCSEAALDRPVRWVHSSEIAEIAPLLKGGELLLTTGLGLADSSHENRVAYIRDLAQRDVSALAFEVGRTFDEVPSEMVDEAQRLRFPIIALRSVVPFVEITEAVHMELVDSLAGELRRGDQIARMFNEALLGGAGISGLVEATGRLLESPAMLVTRARRVVATHEWAPDDSQAEPSPESTRTRRIMLNEEHWGDLHVADNGAGRGGVADLVLEHAATAIALELLRGREGDTALERCRRELIQDLLASRSVTRTELVVRSSLAGFHPPPGQPLVGAALGFREPVNALATFDSALRGSPETALRAAIDGDVLAVLSVPAGAEPDRHLQQLKGQLDALTKNRRPGLAILAVGAAVDDLDAAGSTIREAHLTLRLARQLGKARGLVRSEDFMIERLLTRWSDRVDLDGLVDELLGPLLEYDNAHNSQLVETLACYLATGNSVAKAARELYVRRQTLYARLDRIQELTGNNLHDADQCAALLIGLKALRLADGRSGLN